MPAADANHAPLLTMRGIRKRFGATVALDGVDLDVHAGRVLALVGENGAGKSTLMKVLSGAIAADEGVMTLAGERYRPRHPLDARRSGVAMIYQELSLAPHLSVMENVLLGMEPRVGPILDWSAMHSRTTDALRRLGHGEIDPGTRVGRLPVALQQIVELARALAVGCRVLVLDEPTSSLGRDDVQKLFEMIDRLRDQGHAIVYISHFLEEVQRVADDVVVLRDGRSVGGGTIGEFTTDQIVSLMVGRQVQEMYPRSQRTAGEVVLTVSDLAGVIKPRSASLELRRGEVLGISGLVGAGRTELLRAIFGLDPVKRGTVRVAALRRMLTTTRPRPRLMLRHGVGLLSEDRKSEGLALSLSIADNMTLSRLEGLGPWRFALPSRRRAAAQRWIDRLAVRCRDPWQPVVTLSGGNQQKVAIARLLHHDCDVLLLDEPTRGVDVGSKAQIYQLIDELASAGKAVLLVSSYLPELMGVCDRVAVMSRGRLGPARPVSEVDEHQLMREATGQEIAA